MPEGTGLGARLLVPFPDALLRSFRLLALAFPGGKPYLGYRVNGVEIILSSISKVNIKYIDSNGVRP